MTLPALTLESAHAAAIVVHVSGGAVGIVSGFIALFAPKGGRLHRAAGKLFFLAMLVMALSATTLAALQNQTTNTVGGLFTIYLISTAWAVVLRRPGTVGRMEAAGLLAASAIAAVSISLGLRGGNDAAGVPSAATLVFGIVAAIAALGDLHMLLRRGLQGANRISRHLWRMCTALFVAAGSFFLGQADEIPGALRGPHLFVPPLLALAALVFWLVRVRFGTGGHPAPAAAQARR